MLFDQKEQPSSPTSNSKNLKDDINFDKTLRSSVGNKIDELANLAKDPYAASLPLIASAGLGDKNQYYTACAQMLKTLEILDAKPTEFPEWQRSNSFKAWMWGRVLLAADSMADAETITLAKGKLLSLLDKKITKEDNFSYFTWAWGYRAALNQTEYDISHKRMVNDAVQLTEKYKAKQEDHGALSAALWAWVMNLSASANAGDQHTYALIKEQIKFLTGAESVTKALEIGLLRKSDDNDYPAWALAKVRRAAAIMGDENLYNEISKATESSIEGAKNAEANAEYAISIVENRLATLAGKKLEATMNTNPLAPGPAARG